jgi:hypothetical protein
VTQPLTGRVTTNPSTLHMDGTSPVVVHVAATTEELRAIHNKWVRLVVVDGPNPDHAKHHDRGDEVPPQVAQDFGLPEGAG